MSITKTLGGDRLGSGKKMKVSLHNYERSTHDQSYLWRSTMSAGTLVPFLCEVGLPGTTFDLNLGCEINTHPAVGPLFGSFKVQLDVFLVPMRLYNAHLHNNALGIGRQMANIKLPQIEFKAIKKGSTPADLSNSQVNPSSLPAYLGIRGIGKNTVGAEGDTAPRQFNAIPTLAYWEIVKQYYSNKQEEIGAVIHAQGAALTQTVTSINGYPNGVSTPLPQAPASTIFTLTPGEYIQVNFSGATPVPSEIMVKTAVGNYTMEQLTGGMTVTAAGVLTGTLLGQYGLIELQQWKYITDTDAVTLTPRIETFPLSNIDEMRMAILGHNFPTPFVIDENIALTPYLWLVEQPSGRPGILSSQEGLALKTYQSDIFNNWLKTENIEAISTSTAIDTSAGSFTIDQLIISKKVWNMLNRINVSGGSYDDWLDAVYVHERYKSTENPMYMGGLIKELVFQEVVSNAQAEGEPLGSLAGKGTLAAKHKGGSVVVHVDEPSYLIGIASITPRLDYSQGNRFDVNLQTMDDFHKPPLDEIGFQELILEKAAWWTTYWNGTEWVQQSAGKQPAWLDYMTNYNRTYGNFALPEDEMFMTLNRRYENNNPLASDPYTIQDLTTYIDPAKFNYIFSQQALDAQNFWVQIAVDLTSRRKMSAKLMPNL